MNPWKQRPLVAALFLLATAASLCAEIKLPTLFGDHMVLQEGVPIKVWGTADPGEMITVTMGGESASATADAAGKWQASLAALPANSVPATMTVAGKSNTVTFSDILVGQVWLCSGQSNMAFNLGGGKSGFGGAHNAATVLPLANDPQLRLFRVGARTSLDPVDTLVFAPNFGAGDWELCTSESAARFSAVAYFFGRGLRQHLHQPVGLISASWGGTPAQAWTSLSALKKEPVLQHYVDDEEKVRADYPQASAFYPALIAAYKTDLANWQQTVEDPYKASYAQWLDTAKQAKASGQTVPPMPVMASPAPTGPTPPDGGAFTPTALFNGMIAPLIPFALKGVIWYQGEANVGHAQEYATLFPTLISDWRQKWGEGNFPFLFVQLAGFKDTPVQNWPYLREAQLKTLSLPATGMASAIDIGDPANIHPADKEDVGNRLVWAARHVAYGEDIVYSGPIYESMKLEGDTIRVSFTDVGSGLTIGTAPWVAAGNPPLPGDKLVGFTIAGDDEKWYPADAKVDGNSVIVASPQVPKPIAVRYGWANAPKLNLSNAEGLPASSFRTDDWSDPVAQGLSPTPSK